MNSSVALITANKMCYTVIFTGFPLRLIWKIYVKNSIIFLSSKVKYNFLEQSKRSTQRFVSSIKSLVGMKHCALNVINTSLLYVSDLYYFSRPAKKCHNELLYFGNFIYFWAWYASCTVLHLSIPHKWINVRIHVWNYTSGIHSTNRSWPTADRPMSEASNLLNPRSLSPWRHSLPS